jgi:protein-tyrosine phosphatase
VPYNFAAATPDEPTVFGACRPGHRRAPPDDTVADWLSFVDDRGIDRVCCLLDGEHLSRYDDLLGVYRDHFGADRVLHAPVTDFEPIDRDLFCEAVLPFLREADAAGERVLVHCSAGIGRTGHVLALWLVHGRGHGLEAAIRAVEATDATRAPLEGGTRLADLRDVRCRA